MGQEVKLWIKSYFNEEKTKGKELNGNSSVWYNQTLTMNCSMFEVFTIKGLGKDVNNEVVKIDI